MTSNGCDTCSNKIHPTIRLGIVLVCLLICGLIAKKVMSKLNKHRKYDVMIRHLTELIVVVFDFMQIAGSMSSLYSVRMPSYLKKFLSDANIVNFDIVDMLGLNCLGQDVTFYASFTLVSTVPVMVLVLCWIGYISTTHYARLKVKMLKSEKMGWGRLIRRISLVQQKQRDRRARFLVIGLSTLSLLYMPLTVRCFRFFQCIYVGKSLLLLLLLLLLMMEKIATILLLSDTDSNETHTANHCTPLHTTANHCTPLHTTAHHCKPHKPHNPTQTIKVISWRISESCATPPSGLGSSLLRF